MSEMKLTVIEHLDELRGRLIKMVLCIFILSIIVYIFSSRILTAVSQSVDKLVFISPTEAFGAHISISFWGGMFISSPYILYQIWAFICEGLKEREKKYIVGVVGASFFLFIGGCFTGYFFVLPVGMKFLLSFGSDALIPMVSVNRYISFVGSLIFIFGVIFQLPLIIIFLTSTGLVTPQFLSRRRREVIVMIFILAAFFTPPDVVTQIFIALPLLILYEVSVVLSKVVTGRKKKSS
jgi:sec-independent protein translocase protein TatC